MILFFGLLLKSSLVSERKSLELIEVWESDALSGSRDTPKKILIFKKIKFDLKTILTRGRVGSSLKDKI